MTDIWDGLLDEQDRAVIDQAGYRQHGAASWDSRSLGTRPALIIIDMQRQFVGRDVPILEAIQDHRTAMGEIAWRAIEHLRPFVELCLEGSIPIIYGRVIPQGKDSADPDLAIVDALSPQAHDIVLDKHGSSMFHDSALNERLRSLGVDTIIVTGNSTSGCVRATAVDGRQHGYAVLVPIEGVFDRILASHKIALLDLWMKYAAVASLSDVSDYVRQTAGW